MDGTSTNNLSVQKKRRGGNGGAGEQLQFCFPDVDGKM